MTLLAGKHVLITGAARGIGAAIAEACLRQGAAVLITDRDEAALATAFRHLAPLAAKLHHCPLDITDATSIAKTLKTIADWPALDGLVNNAAMLDISTAATLTDDRFTTVLDVNLMGALRVTRAALPRLKDSPAAAIVNTLSSQAFAAVPNSAAYSTAKGGLHMLTRSMAVDFAPDIRVNGVAPGFIDTRMAITAAGNHEHEEKDFLNHYIDGGRIPLRRPGQPEDCAGAFVFLLSDQARYITGQTLNVDGGLSATY